MLSNPQILITAPALEQDQRNTMYKCVGLLEEQAEKELEDYYLQTIVKIDLLTVNVTIYAFHIYTGKFLRMYQITGSIADLGDDPKDNFHVIVSDTPQPMKQKPNVIIDA